MWRRIGLLEVLKHLGESALRGEKSPVASNSRPQSCRSLRTTSVKLRAIPLSRIALSGCGGRSGWRSFVFPPARMTDTKFFNLVIERAGGDV